MITVLQVSWRVTLRKITKIVATRFKAKMNEYSLFTGDNFQTLLGELRPTALPYIPNCI